MPAAGPILITLLVTAAVVALVVRARGQRCLDKRLAPFAAWERDVRAAADRDGGHACMSIWPVHEGSDSDA